MFPSRGWARAWLWEDIAKEAAIKHQKWHSFQGVNNLFVSGRTKVPSQNIQTYGKFKVNLAGGKADGSKRGDKKYRDSSWVTQMFKVCATSGH